MGLCNHEELNNFSLIPFENKMDFSLPFIKVMRSCYITWTNLFQDYEIIFLLIIYANSKLLFKILHTSIQKRYTLFWPIFTFSKGKRPRLFERYIFWCLNFKKSEQDARRKTVQYILNRELRRLWKKAISKDKKGRLSKNLHTSEQWRQAQVTNNA